MTELLTAAQMRAIEQAAIDSGEVTGLELMERAGRGVVEAIFEEWPELKKTSHRAVVLCGPGNNGGDGFVVARMLKEWGWEVEVFLYGDPEKLPPDARVNYERLHAVKLNEDFWGQAAWEADLVVDAFFGIGKIRPPEGDLARAIQIVADSMDDSRIVSIDIPTGLCAHSGKPLLPYAQGDAYCIRADLTVTFHLPKIGHVVSEGPLSCTSLKTVEIGLRERDFWNDQKADHEGYTQRDNAIWNTQIGPLPKDNRWFNANEIQGGHLRKWKYDHKYSHGHALILSGGPGKTGAARLAARGALRIGAGLVTIGCPQQALWEVAAHETAIMCHPLDGAPGLNEKLEDDRLNALCLGPGMGLGADTQVLVLAALAADRKTVLDADALTRFERNPEVLFDALHENCILTPHGGEFKRLFPDIAEKLCAPATTGPAYSKVDATREAATRAGCTILFKGPDTVIADQTGRCAINSSAYDRAAPWLATAGSGDVLAGFITGLLARGFGPMQAAETGAWLHTECALSFGPGLIAGDLPEELPKVFRSLDL